MKTFGCIFRNWNASPLCRGAACASHLQRSSVGSEIFCCCSLVLHSCPSRLVIRWLLMIFHTFLSFVRAWSGGGRIPRLVVGISRFVIFSLRAAKQISKEHRFSTFLNGVIVEREFDVNVLWLTGGMLSGWRPSVAICSLLIFVKRLL